MMTPLLAFSLALLLSFASGPAHLLPASNARGQERSGSLGNQPGERDNGEENQELPLPARPEALLETPVGPFQVPYDAVHERRLANGLVLVAVSDPSVPLVDVAIALRVGARLEESARKDGSRWPAGVASMTASMLSRGGVEGVAPEALDAQLEFFGLRVESFGGRHRSGLVASGSVRDFDRLSLHCAQMLTQPAFDAARFDFYRRNIDEGLARRYDSGQAVAEREWLAAIFGRDHARARPLTRADTAQWSPELLRQFHATYYQPSETVIAVAGGLDPVQALDRFEELLAGWSGGDGDPGDHHRPVGGSGSAEGTAEGTAEGPSGPRGHLNEIGTAAQSEDASTTGVLAPERAVSQSRSQTLSTGQRRAEAAPKFARFAQLPRPLEQGILLIGALGLERRSWADSRSFVAELLGEILGGPGPVSRLRGRLRSREGLVYNAWGGVGVGSSEEGLIEMGWQVDPDNALQSLRAGLEEIERLRNVAVRQVELDLARKSLIDSLPSLFDSAEKVAGRYAEDVLLGRPHEFWQNYAQRLEAVTSSDLERLAREVLQPSRFDAVWIGPMLPEKALEALGFRLVQILPERDPVTLEPVSQPARARGQ